MENCAILVFAKNSFSESHSKRIVFSEKENLNLWNTLNNKTLQIAEKSKIPYFMVNESIQVGNTFGERISHSVKTIFDKGFEKIIVIGNDCPELTVAHLKKAKLKLADNDFVFGPDFKGGAYLLGISKFQFNLDDFQSLNWQSNQLFKNLTALYKNSNIAILSFLTDVNDTFSFKKSVHKLNFNTTLKTKLLLFLTFFNHFFNFLIIDLLIIKILFLKYRGPPITRCYSEN